MPTRPALAIAALLVPILALLRLHQAGLQGLGRVAIGLAPESLVQPIVMTTLAATVGIFAWAPRTAEVALVLQTCAAGAALTVAALLLRRGLPAGLAAEPARHRMKAWLAAGSAFMWLVGMSVALVNIDTLLVGMLLGPAQAGAYRVAGQLAMLVGFPLAAVSLAMAPSIAALHATGQREALRARARSAARVIVAVSLLIAVVVVVIGRPLLAALGPGFESAFPATLVLVAAYLFHASMATSTYLLFMTAHERLAAGIFTLGVAVNVAGGLLLIPRFGIVGGAVAAGIGLVLVSAVSALIRMAQDRDQCHDPWVHATGGQYMNPLRRAAHLLRQGWLSLTMRSSGDYWERRYRLGMTSGPGSAGKLASFKADVLNEFVRDNGVQSVIEFGCGDGTQLTLAKYPSLSRPRCLARGDGSLRRSFAGTTPSPSGLTRRTIGAGMSSKPISRCRWT